MGSYGRKREAFREELSRAEYKEGLIQDWRAVKSSWALFVTQYNNYLHLGQNPDLDENLRNDQLYHLYQTWEAFNVRLIFFWSMIRPYLKLTTAEKELYTEFIYYLPGNLTKEKIIWVIDTFFKKLEDKVTALISLSEAFIVDMNLRGGGGE